MDDPGRTCDADTCDRRATQIGVAELPVRPLELRLCDEHVAALRAGKVTGLAQERRRHDGGYTRPRVSFAE